MGFFVAATWQCSGKGVQTAAECLARGKDIMDALESGIGAVEDDPEVLSVGLGGYPNCQGECELDAGIMDGRTLATGAVLGLKGFPHPISVARKLLEETPHTAVAGAGADAFAYEHGFERRQVFHRRAYDRWFDIREQYISSGRRYPPLDACTAGRCGVTGNLELDDIKKGSDGGRSHDTVGMIVRDGDGNVAAGTSTSGLWLKIPGRIGDTPIIGSGFYADNEGGAAVATGVGEEIMRGCMSYLAVLYMGEGLAAQAAAEKAIGKLHRRLAMARGGDSRVGKMALVCVDRAGNVGAAANHEEFRFCCAADAPLVKAAEAPVIR